jgi:hypothetical protein
VFPMKYALNFYLLFGRKMQMFVTSEKLIPTKNVRMRVLNLSDVKPATIQVTRQPL